MLIKMFWESCSEFVIENQDGFLIEASPAETLELIVPVLSPHERLKFESMKDHYISKKTDCGRAGMYYFLVSRDAQMIKFESAAFFASDLSSRGGTILTMPDIPIDRIEDICHIDTRA
jgi:hypothetical protein